MDRSKDQGIAHNVVNGTAFRRVRQHGHDWLERSRSVISVLLDISRLIDRGFVTARAIADI